MASPKKIVFKDHFMVDAITMNSGNEVFFQDKTMGKRILKINMPYRRVSKIDKAIDVIER